MFSLNQKTITEKRYILHRNDLLAVTKDLNFGLVPDDLLALLSMYQIALEIINDVPDEEYKMIELRIRNNIIEGYQK
jgi:hypothetical protein